MRMGATSGDAWVGIGIVIERHDSAIINHYKFLFLPIPINNIGNDAVNHFVEKWLAQEAIVMGNDIFHIEHAHYVGYEIRCFCQWRRQPFALNGYGQLRIVVLWRDKNSIEQM